MTIIINGGEPLPGCPNDWDQANEIEFNLNGKKERDEIEGPSWRFDCGFKLDYDGPLISVSSRFYPPKTGYGATWDGGVTIFILGKPVDIKKFDCPTLDELKNQVDQYVTDFVSKIVLVK